MPQATFVPAAIVGVVVVVLGLVGYMPTTSPAWIWAHRAPANRCSSAPRRSSERARPEYQDLALATLPPNPRNGSFYRLDDRLLEAKIVEQPVIAEADGAVLYAFDFDDAANPA